MKHIKIFLIISMILLLFLVGCDDSSSSDSDGDGPDSEEDDKIKPDIALDTSVNGFNARLVSGNSYSDGDCERTINGLIPGTNWCLIEEETASTKGYWRAADIAVDSISQPHIVTEDGGINAYHRIGGQWFLQEPLFTAMPFVPHIEIDSNDRAWIQASRPSSFIQDYDMGTTHCCDSMSLMHTVATTPKFSWGPIKINTGFVASIYIDPYFPDKAFHYNHNGVIVEWSNRGMPTRLNTPASCCGGEGGDVAIAPLEDQQGVIHTVAGGTYRNTLLADSIEWISSNQWTDHTYSSISADLKNPNVAYLSSPVNGLSLNIWVGTKLAFPANSPHVLDNNPVGESANGGSQGRIKQGWAPAKEGGAFICWTSADGVKLKYITYEDYDKWGDTITIGPGSQCAIATDINGSIHMVYNNGGVKYRKIIPQVI